MVDEQTENSKLSNKTKTKNNLNHFKFGFMRDLHMHPLIWFYDSSLNK